MAKSTGDLWPQASGSASLGAEMSNGGYTGSVRPFASLHLVSGVLYDPMRGSSGVFRLQRSANPLAAASAFALGLSFDGGTNFPLELGIPGFNGTNTLNADITAPLGNIRVTAVGNASVTTVGAGKSVSLTTSRGLIQVQAIGGGVSQEGDIALYPNQNLDIQAFNASGQFTYRFGPYQSWYMKTSIASTGGPFDDGFWPIAHSGNIREMIGNFATLQTAYDAGSTIITSKSKPVKINGNAAAALRIEVAEDLFHHIELSGILRAPSSARFVSQGYLVLTKHSMNLNDGIVSSITDQAFIDAASMGLPTLWMHCGQSGIAPMRLGSGISQFFNVAASTAIDEIGLYSPITPASQAVPDRFFAGVSSSGVKVMVPGLYKALYSASIEKTAGELEQQINCELRVNDQWGNAYRIFGGASYATVRDSGNNPNNTANGQCIFDIDQGETINIFGQTSVVPVAPNSCRFRARSVNLILEYIGPKHGIGSVRQKI